MGNPWDGQIEERLAAQQRAADTTLVRAVHCWVRSSGGEWLPGVLAQWHQDGRGWHGLVAFSAPWWDQRSRVWQPRLARDWLPAERLRIEGIGRTGLPPDRPERGAEGRPEPR